MGVRLNEYSIFKHLIVGMVSYFMNFEENINIFCPKISIIVAAYNQEKNIEKCLKSIVCQLYKNIEIVVVNDGSTDNTKNICEKYSYQDSRIILIHQENGGVSNARNVGLKYITGDYVTFVDADDYIDKNMIENYIPYLEKFRKNILISGYRRIRSNRIEYIYQESFRVLKKHEALQILFNDNSFKNYMWNKLYPSCFFKNIKFEENKTYEDIRIQYKLFEISKFVVICPFIGYNYIFHTTSITNNKFFVLDAVDAHVERIIYVQNKAHEFVPLLSQKLFSLYRIIR